jgi:hypothetical protein
MRQLAIVLSVAIVALVAAGTSVGAQARHLAIHIDETFHSDFLSEECGVDVFIDLDADLNVTLVYNQSGLLVREIDPSGGGTFTYYSPDTGKSFSFPFQPAMLDYGSGAMVGSAVIVTQRGLFGHVPGFVPSDAGLFRFLGSVTGFEENGSPLIDFVEVIPPEHGNRVDGEQVVAGICAALTDP